MGRQEDMVVSSGKEFPSYQGTIEGYDLFKFMRNVKEANISQTQIRNYQGLSHKGCKGSKRLVQLKSWCVGMLHSWECYSYIRCKHAQNLVELLYSRNISYAIIHNS